MSYKSAVPFDHTPLVESITKLFSGELNLNADCKFQVTVRKGNINENPRGGSIREFVVQIGEGLGVVNESLSIFDVI